MSGVDLAARFVSAGLGRPQHTAALAGGCVGEVLSVQTDHGRFVAKLDRTGEGPLSAEGRMLRYLADKTDLPVPEVFVSDAHLLVMAPLPGDTGARGPAEEHAADLLADLHDRSANTFGFAWPTVIGGLWQDNTRQSHWPTFFWKHRVLDMAQQGHEAGMLPAPVLDRLRAAETSLLPRVPDDVCPALIHGDIWSGNVLSDGPRITGFIDPAIYFAHGEMELAFITLFSTFGDRFFSRYAERRPLSPHFHDELRHIYNLYPLLVHVRLFGAGYVQQVEGTLERFAG